jgi:AraC family transcriptional regulator of arabinose operon
MAGSISVTPGPWSTLESPGSWWMPYTSSGSARFRVGSAEVTTEPGDLLLIKCTGPIERSIPGPRRWRVHHVHFDAWPGWDPSAPFAALGTHLFRARAVLLSTRQRIEDAYRRIIADLRAREAAEALAGLQQRKSKSTQAETETLRELSLAAITEIVTLLRRDDLEIARLDPRVAAALQVITDDLAARHDARALARRAGLSPSRFMHLFREQLGVPLRIAVRTLRLQQAALLLAYGNEPVGGIAEEVGFPSIYAFSGEFRRAYGVSPSRYREEARTPSVSRSERRIAASARERAVR